MRAFLVILILSLHISAWLFGQQPYIQVISKEKGFGQSSISSLIEDHEGVIWVGTQLGLLRFDGLKTISYLPEKNNPNSLSNEYINDLFEDKDHNIWVATRNGLNCIDPSRKKITRFFRDTDDPTTIPGNGIFELVPNSDTTFYVICGRYGFGEFNRKTKKSILLNPLWQQDPLHKPYEDRFVVEVLITKSKDILIRSNTGRWRYDPDHNSLDSIRDYKTGFFNIDPYPNYCMSREGAIWFSDWNGILYKWIPFRWLECFDDTLIRRSFDVGELAILDYDDAHVLLASANNLLLVNKANGQSQPFNTREDQKSILNTNQIRHSLLTRNGSVFLASAQGNLLLVDPLRQQFRFKPIFTGDNQRSMTGEVSDFFDDLKSRKRFISSVIDSFFYVEDLVSGKITAVRKQHIGNVGNKWLFDHQGRLWLCDGTQVDEISRTDYTSKVYKAPDEVKNIFGMIEIKPGVMMVASYRSGLFRFEPDRQGFELIPEKRGWLNSQITCIALDKKHNCAWIGTSDHGVFQYDIGRDTFFIFANNTHNPKSIGADWIREITLDSTGHVWFAVEPIGLSRFSYDLPRDSAFLNLTMGEGLPSSYISGICTDAQGYIWMTSLNGIAQLNPFTFAVKQYRKTDGLAFSKFTRTSITITPSNLILIGGAKGYIYFNPQTLKTNHAPPDVVMQDILVLNNSKFPDREGEAFKPLELRYNQNYLTFRFSIINFTDPESNAVKYMLEGLDDDWTVRTGITEVNYTKVPPGAYTFRILAANNNGIWNYKETNVPILIHAAFWQTNWFYILIGLIAGGLVLAFYNFRLKQLLKQNKLIAEREFVKAESERQLSQLEMTALRAQMNPHFVFNCLNSINRFIVVNDNEAASEYLTKFSKLIRQVLDNSRGEKVLLATEIETLKLYIDMESLRFTDKFQYVITMDPDIDPGTWTIQPMLIQPYVENAIWHGLMHRKTKGILQIHFALKNESVAVTIRDNGVGRAKAKQIKESQLITRKSHGMKVTAQRMALLSKKLNVKVEAEIEDLVDENGEAAGTGVYLTLPIEKVQTPIESNSISQP